MTADVWLASLADLVADPECGLQSVEVDETGGDAIRLQLTFTAVDLRGEPYTARGRVVLPVAHAWDIWFNCGYELRDESIREHMGAGRVVVTPVEPQGEEVFPYANPLCRGTNTDVALAHIIRRLPCVDPLRIVYGGGSAGGYAALLVAAEAFPAGAVVANAPVVNLAYQAAFTMRNAPALAADPPSQHPTVGLLMAMFVPFVDRGWKRAFGDDLTDPLWVRHSPLGHVDRITCPVATFFSTADFLVPLHQVSAALAEAAGAPPSALVTDSATLSSAAGVGVRLLDVLGDRAHVVVLDVPEDARVATLDDLDLTLSVPQSLIDVPPAEVFDWLVTILDEGPIAFGCGHTKHEIQPSFDDYLEAALSRLPKVDQLTSAKLEQLVMRWSGEEWLAAGFRHLDSPAAEQADVMRGLRAYCGVSPAHAQRFDDLYAALEPAHRVFPVGLVRELTHAC